MDSDLSLDTLISVRNGSVIKGNPAILPSWLPSDYLENNQELHGGYTGDGIYHVFGSDADPRHSITSWNLASKWKSLSLIPPESYVFCENILGDQFYFLPGRSEVFRFSPYTAASEVYDINYSEFCEGYIIDFFDVHIEIKATLRKYGPVPVYHHLSPLTHPMLGGDFSPASEWKCVESLSNLIFSCQISTQASRLAEGTKIVGVEWDPSTKRVTLITDNILN